MSGAPSQKIQGLVRWRCENDSVGSDTLILLISSRHGIVSYLSENRLANDNEGLVARGKSCLFKNCTQHDTSSKDQEATSAQSQRQGIGINGRTVMRTSG